jgi:NAD(P)-dependent dehydrogenase (short-subunit alcohol dehydrogenase family)
MMDVNVRGTWSTVHHAAHHLERAAGKGESCVVTMGSVASKRPSHGAYSVSKCAVWMLTRVLAHQWAPSGVRANCVAPGSIDTAMLRQVAAETGDEEAWLAGRAARIPLGRIGTVDDVAAAVLFLVGPSSSYITGSLVHPDGGLINIDAGG